jgi:hypothetical protein
MSIKLFVFGDSFVSGDQDDFLEENKLFQPPAHNMDWYSRDEYLKYNVSFSSHIARSLGIDMLNYAKVGSGNQVQVDRLYSLALARKINTCDIVLFGLTSSWRDRAGIKVQFGSKTLPMLNFADESLSEDELAQRDYLYTNILLADLQIKYGFKMIVVNLWQNLIDLPNNFRHVLGYQLAKNTLIDVLNDTWGIAGEPTSYVGNIPSGYEFLYTRTRSPYPAHPSAAGHKKIANWLLDQKLFD